MKVGREQPDETFSGTLKVALLPTAGVDSRDIEPRMSVAN